MGGGLGVLVIAVIMMLLGKNPMAMLSNMPSGMGGQAAPTQAPTGGDNIVANSPEEAEMLKFIGAVLGNTEDVWGMLFDRNPKLPAYPAPTLVRFRDMVNSACGTQSSAVGPFYCSGDDTIFLDLTFFNELAKRHRAAGDFAQAYVIAHEVGHHIQNVIGITQFVAQKKRGLGEAGKNQWSVRQELHADYLAGVWAHYADQQNLLDRGDREEALNAAAQIGDDTLQRRARGQVRPVEFTHGTARQRQRWFMKGMQAGDMESGLGVYEAAYEDL